MPEAIKDLVVRGSELKLQIQNMTKLLHDINTELVKVAEFKNGSKSGHLFEAGIKVTVQVKENIKYLQDRLMQLKDLVPEAFNEAFVYEYKPASSKALLAAMKENADFAKGVEWSRQITPGAPYVTYEKIDDDVLLF